jgi:hypothetical protein
MHTNPAPYPRWERHGHVRRFYLGPGLPIYEVEERALLGGALFVASAVDTAELIGQFESEHHAPQACARDHARRAKAGRAPQGSKNGESHVSGRPVGLGRPHPDLEAEGR